MKVSIRQGIIRARTDLTGPAFLQKTTLSGTSIDWVNAPVPTLLTFAHYDTNYLVEQTSNISMAWGGDSPGSSNGPLVAVGQTQYLYWDIDLATGALSRGWTLLSPSIGPNPPLNPQNDQHWFDTTNTRMRVFRKPGASPGNWQDRIRLFAATYDSNAIIIPQPIGFSQVGLSAGNYSAGNIIYGVNNKPLKQSDGTFATTETLLIVGNTGGQNVKFDAAVAYAQAQEEIPEFYLVSFTPNRRIKLASSLDEYSFVSGMVVEDLHENETGQVITNGVIRNENWDWQPLEINKPLFCGPTGELTLSAPPVGVSQQVGFVYDQDSIFLNLFPPVRLR